MSDQARKWAFELPLDGPRKWVLFVLAEHADESGECSQSIAVLARYSGCQERAVRYALKELRSTGFIEIMDGGRKPNRYTLNLSKACDAEQIEPQKSIVRHVVQKEIASHAAQTEEKPACKALNAVEPHCEASHAGLTEYPFPAPLPLPPSSLSFPPRPPLTIPPTTIPITPPIPLPALDLFAGPAVPKRAKIEDAPEFKRFWSIYPRKKEGPGAARGPWARALTKATAEEIIAGLERYAFDDREKGHWLPHAATWLNQERWRGEADTVPVTRVVNGHSNGKPTQTGAVQALREYRNRVAVHEMTIDLEQEAWNEA